MHAGACTAVEASQSSHNDAGLSTVSQEPHQDLGASTGRVSALSVPITTTTTSSSSSGSRSLQAVQQFSAPCSHLRNGPLDPGVTSCLQWQQAVGCGLLEAQGYIAGAGVQSFTPDRLTGNFTAPAGACGSTSISLVLRRTQQQQQQQLVFDAGSRTALAVIVKGAAASTYLLARGVTKVCMCINVEYITCLQSRHHDHQQHMHQLQLQHTIFCCLKLLSCHCCCCYFLSCYQLAAAAQQHNRVSSAWTQHQPALSCVWHHQERVLSQPHRRPPIPHALHLALWHGSSRRVCSCRQRSRMELCT